MARFYIHSANREIKALYNRLNDEWWGGRLPDIPVVINTRLSRAGGRAISNMRGPVKVEIAAFLFEAHLKDPGGDLLEDTMKHEMCHVRHPLAGHNRVFKAEMHRVGAIRFIPAGIAAPPRRNRCEYKMVCERCGFVHTFRRRPKWWNGISRGEAAPYSHKGCGGRLTKGSRG